MRQELTGARTPCCQRMQADVSLLLWLAMRIALKHVCIVDLDDNRTPTSHHAYSVGVL